MGRGFVLTQPAHLKICKVCISRSYNRNQQIKHQCQLCAIWECYEVEHRYKYEESNHQVQVSAWCLYDNNRVMKNFSMFRYASLYDY